ncbi:MAG: hypothetical protein V1753_01770, partial [Pseudomonadota bacterium]
MKNNSWFLKSLCVVAVFAWSTFFLAGCSSSGGGNGPSDLAGNDESGDNNGDSSPVITYSGKTTPVTITGNNAVELTTSGYQLGKGTGAVGIGAGAIEQDKESVGRSRGLVLSQALTKALSKVDVADLNSNYAVHALQQEEHTGKGSCGGEMSYSISINDQTGSFTGSFVFSGYCEDDPNISGDVTVCGVIDLESEGFLQITMTFTELSISMLDESFTVK